MPDLLAVYKKRDPFYFRSGIMLLMASLFCWLLNARDNYLTLGFGMLLIYLLQYLMERMEKPKTLSVI